MFTYVWALVYVAVVVGILIAYAAPRVVSDVPLVTQSLDQASELYRRNFRIRGALMLLAIPAITADLFIWRVSGFKPGHGSPEDASRWLMTLAAVASLFFGSILAALVGVAIRQRGFVARMPKFRDCLPPARSTIASGALILSLLLVVPLCIFSGPNLFPYLLGFLILWLVFARLVSRYQLATLKKNRVVLDPNDPYAKAIEEAGRLVDCPTGAIVVTPGLRANAMVLKDGSILVFRAALKLLSPDEIKAVLVHEFSHQLDGDVRRLRVRRTVSGLMVILFAPPITFVFLAFGAFYNGSVVAMVAICLILIRPLRHLIHASFSQKLEFKCDAFAKGFGCGPDLASALIKLSRYNGTPLEWTRWDGYLLTHPTLLARLEKLDSLDLLGTEQTVTRPT